MFQQGTQAVHSIQEAGRLPWLAALDEEFLREVAMYKLEGYTNEEIAEKISRSVKTVERKLALIRKLWSKMEEE